MKLAEHVVTLAADQEKAWAKLIDWQTMPAWDIFMESVSFDGPLKAGSSGRLKMKGGPNVSLVVTDFQPPNSYTDQFSLFGSRFIFYHQLEQSVSGKLTMRFTAEGEGLLVAALAGYFQRQFRINLPILMGKFKEQLEAQV